MKNIRISAYIQSYREERGLTQGEFGRLLGVSAVAVSKWERQLCYPDIFLLPNLSALLGVSIDEMLGNERFCRLPHENQTHKGHPES